MLSMQLLDVVPLWFLYPFTLVFSLVMAEIGFRIGKTWQTRTKSDKDPAVGAMVGASLGLLALLLAFVIGIAASRFDTRRTLIITDANAIGTTELRARYLPEPYRSASRTLFREYVDIRTGTTDMSQVQIKARSEQIQGELWAGVEELAQESPQSEVLALYIDALNSMIDVHGERVAAIMTRVPQTLILLLFLIAWLSMFLIGFANSYEGKRSGIALVVLVLIFSTAIFIVVDLDRPNEGLLTISPQPMLDLQQQLHQ